MISKYLYVGNGGYVDKKSIIAILDYQVNAIKKKVKQYEEAGLVVNLTNRKKIRSAILTNNDYIFLSSITPKTLLKYLEQGE